MFKTDSYYGKDVEHFMLRSWGRCAPMGYDLGLDVSRLCPLAREAYQVAHPEMEVPPSFSCKSFRTHECPAESWVPEAALARMQELEAQEFERRMQPLLPLWRAEYCDDSHVLANIEGMVAEVVDAYKAFKRTGVEPNTGRWHDNQCVLFSLLCQGDHAREAAAAA